MKMRFLSYALITSLFMSGCSYDALTAQNTAPTQRIAHTQTSPMTHVAPHGFDDVMQALVAQIKADANYRKIGLKTPKEKQWFKATLYKLWHRDITRSDFIAQGVKRYPTKRYEFTFIADAMQRI